jgi:PHD/YefM family antitoxin component YafN of YafNO toxin-antitoxin module
MFAKGWTDITATPETPRAKAKSSRDPLTPLLIAVLAHRGEPVVMTAADKPAEVLTMLRDFERCSLEHRDLDHTMWAAREIASVARQAR